ncbi:hypothetical protein QQ045_011717 [Rhodiola kirilowii]
MGQAGGAEEEKKPEKTVFELKLESYEAASKIKVIKEVRSFTDLEWKEARIWLNAGMSKEKGEQIIEKMKRDRPLKVSYKKLWSLALNKNAKVKEMGFWAEGNWLWQLKFRRSLYQWEEVKKDELLRTLCHVQLKDEEVDHIVWTHSEDGRFRVNSLMKAALEIKRTKNKWDTLSFQVWSGLAQPKVELLVWRLYHESLPTKESFYRKGVLSATHNLNCDLCDQHVESTDHLLLQCSWSWKLWSWCIQWWEATGWCHTQ